MAEDEERMLERTNLGQSQMALGFGPERRIYGVGELSAAIQGLFSDKFQAIWVAGEISGCKPSASGHYYFSLKDRDAQIKCVLFKGAARFVKFRPQDGMAVLVRGSMDLYLQRGDIQLIVELLEPQGAGALQVAFEQLKKKLAAEGLFAADRKRLLPRLPRRIGLVTSPSGAVFRDMVHVLERRFPGLQIRLYPAQVQGDGAVEQICAGLRYFSQHAWPEVVIVARGGGSIEDLWSFNEEAVARAVAASAIPVISAIGHETDFTICDFVADYRAPTPSAAAEIVICTRESLLEQLRNHRAKLTQALRYRILSGYRRLENVGSERAGRVLHREITKRSQFLDDIDRNLGRALESALGTRRSRLSQLQTRLERSDLRLRVARSIYRNQQLRDQLGQVSLFTIRSQQVQEASLKVMRLTNQAQQLRTVRLQSNVGHLTNMSPLVVLRRGYAIVEKKNGHVVRSSAEASVGEDLRIRLNEGQLTVKVAN